MEEFSSKSDSKSDLYGRPVVGDVGPDLLRVRGAVDEHLLHDARGPEHVERVVDQGHVAQGEEAARAGEAQRSETRVERVRDHHGLQEVLLVLGGQVVQVGGLALIGPARHLAQHLKSLLEQVRAL